MALADAQVQALHDHFAAYGALTVPELRSLLGNGMVSALDAGLYTLTSTDIGPLAFPLSSRAYAYLRSPGAATDGAYIRLAIRRLGLKVEVPDPTCYGVFTHPQRMPQATYRGRRVCIAGKVLGEGISTRRLRRYVEQHLLTFRRGEQGLLVISPTLERYRNLAYPEREVCFFEYRAEHAHKDNS